jgi:hypothetical protein
MNDYSQERKYDFPLIDMTIPEDPNTIETEAERLP